eukprot:scaffold62855_cov56-Phaeocystis_antarctica.AAC.2
MRPSSVSLLCATTLTGFSPAAGIICSRFSRPWWVAVCARFHALLASSRSQLSPSFACVSSMVCSALRVIGAPECSVRLVERQERQVMKDTCPKINRLLRRRACTLSVSAMPLSAAGSAPPPIPVSLLTGLPASCWNNRSPPGLTPPGRARAGTILDGVPKQARLAHE